MKPASGKVISGALRLLVYVLACYAPRFGNTNNKKARRFRDRLVPEIRTTYQFWKDYHIRKC